MMSKISLRALLGAVIAFLCFGEAASFSKKSETGKPKVPFGYRQPKSQCEDLQGGVFQPGDYEIIWNACSKPCGVGFRVGHIVWKKGDLAFGKLTPKYSRTYKNEKGKSKMCDRYIKEFPKTIIVKSSRQLHEILTDNDYELTDKRLEAYFRERDKHYYFELNAMPGHLFEACNPDPCPSDSTVDNLLETLNDILTDAGNPNLKLCPA